MPKTVLKCGGGRRYKYKVCKIGETWGVYVYDRKYRVWLRMMTRSYLTWDEAMTALTDHPPYPLPGPSDRF